jgi:hypothetical protein
MLNVFEKFVVKIKKKTHFILRVFPPPPPENRAVYEVLWKNTAHPDRPQI